MWRYDNLVRLVRDPVGFEGKREQKKRRVVHGMPSFAASVCGAPRRHKRIILNDGLRTGVC